MTSSLFFSSDSLLPSLSSPSPFLIVLVSRPAMSAWTTDTPDGETFADIVKHSVEGEEQSNNSNEEVRSLLRLSTPFS